LLEETHYILYFIGETFLSASVLFGAWQSSLAVKFIKTWWTILLPWRTD